ncbi:uncharacterized protein LOC128270128 [Anopheles cruzii]|uniref:uncharacterized protein LOC128270128 n=1 Tax=Anopheles cruzii TaxID=68878 RepID=UPI0022EC3C08|nr:uncharacterized protein LOC128270128 [Anopheles cruzii]
MKLSVVTLVCVLCLALQVSHAAPVAEASGDAVATLPELTRPAENLKAVAEADAGQPEDGQANAAPASLTSGATDQAEDLSERAEGGVSNYVQEDSVDGADAAEGSELTSNVRVKRSVACTELVGEDGVKRTVCEQDQDAESSDASASEVAFEPSPNLRSYGGGHEGGHGHEHKGYGHEHKGYGHHEHKGYGHEHKGYGHHEHKGYGHEMKGYGHGHEAHGYGHEAHGHGHDGGYGHKKTYRSANYDHPAPVAHGGYGGHAEPVKCGANLLFGCSPSVTKVPCHPVHEGYGHGGYGDHGAASELSYRFAAPEPVQQDE